MNGRNMSTVRRPRQSEILLEILREAALFHTPDGTAYADIEIRGHRETWMLHAPGFRRWLTCSYYRKIGGAPSNDAFQEALRTAEAQPNLMASSGLSAFELAAKRATSISIWPTPIGALSGSTQTVGSLSTTPR